MSEVQIVLIDVICEKMTDRFGKSNFMLPLNFFIVDKSLIFSYLLHETCNYSLLPLMNDQF